jgi:hypothetical protein
MSKLQINDTKDLKRNLIAYKNFFGQMTDPFNYQIFIPTNRARISARYFSVPDAGLSGGREGDSVLEVSPIKFPNLFVAVNSAVGRRVHVGQRHFERNDAASVFGVCRSAIHPKKWIFCLLFYYILLF